MAASTPNFALSCAILVILVMCQPVQAQAQAQGVVDLGPIITSDGGISGSGTGSSNGGAAGNSGGPDNAAPSSPRAGGVDAIVSALQIIGTDQQTIDSIAAALPKDDAALRELMVPEQQAAGASGVWKLRSPAQAAVAFNDVVNNAFRNASESLSSLIFRQNLWPSARGGVNNVNNGNNWNNGNNGNSFNGFPGIVAGFGWPLDVSVMNVPFMAGTGLPPVWQATQQDYNNFVMQMIADLNLQGRNFAKQIDTFQKQAKDKAQVDKALNQACVQYALSQFLNTFSNMLLGLNIPAAGVMEVMGQLSGLGYTGLTPTGNVYLNAYCCDMVRRSGINMGLGFNTDGVVNFGNVKVDLNGLMAAISNMVPVGTQAGDAAATVANVAGQAVNALGSIVNALPKCNVMDWMAFALQGDKQLAQQFNRLINAAMKLNVRMLTQVRNIASKMNDNAVNMVKRIGNSNAAANAVAGNLGLGALIDVVNANSVRNSNDKNASNKN
ncbi:hypothetical protein Vafri_370 [Volvox africanus]|nr:hypothetical protein Vafri_370 [Volvox africanus]